MLLIVLMKMQRFDLNLMVCISQVPVSECVKLLKIQHSFPSTSS